MLYDELAISRAIDLVTAVSRGIREAQGQDTSETVDFQHEALVSVIAQVVAIEQAKIEIIEAIESRRRES